jgi:hypothetical protein
VNCLGAHIWSASASGKPGNFLCREKQPVARSLLDQLSLGISRKRMFVLAMLPGSSVMTAMSTTCSDLGRSYKNI